MNLTLLVYNLVVFGLLIQARVENNFLSIPANKTDSNIELNVLLKTLSKNGLIIFTIGKNYLINITLADGSVNISILLYDQLLRRKNHKFLSDGNWHEIKLQTFKNKITVIIDGEMVKIYGLKKRYTFHNAKKEIYLGGSCGDHNKTSDIVVCMKKLTFSEVNLLSSTEQKYFNSSCRQSEFENKERIFFEKDYNNQRTFSKVTPVSDYKNISKFHIKQKNKRSPNEFGSILKVHELVVEEGHRTFLTRKNIKYHENKHIDESLLVFKISIAPHHGHIIINKDAKDIKDLEDSAFPTEFTLKDIADERVIYFHDKKSKATMDYATFKLLSPKTLGSDQKHLPEEFVLPIYINQNNDPPFLHVAEVIKMVSNSHIQLFTDHLSASDPDDPDVNLTYKCEVLPSTVDSSMNQVQIMRMTAIQQGYANETLDRNYHEISTTADLEPVSEFKHDELVSGKIVISHSGASLQKIQIIASDGKANSQLQFLHVEAHTVKIDKKSNVNLIVVRGTETTLSEKHMNYSVITSHKDVGVLFSLIRAPRVGRLQIRYSSQDHWSIVKNSTVQWKQDDIKEGKLKYVNDLYEHGHKSDSFEFKVSCLGVELSRDILKIDLVQSEAIVKRNTGVTFVEEKECNITRKHLLSTSSISFHSEEDIVYGLVATPRFGHLYLLKDTNQTNSNFTPVNKHKTQKLIDFKSNFTQLDINQGKISYRLRSLPSFEQRDDFEFFVFVPGYQTGPRVFQITFYPVYPPHIKSSQENRGNNFYRLINNGLMNVFEGTSKIISTNDLRIEPFGGNNAAVAADHNVHGQEEFLFTVKTNVTHGKLVKSNSLLNVEQSEIETFTMSDLRNSLISYVHDDSENEFDFFEFQVEPTAVSKTLQLTATSGTFEIKVLLRNDNPPKRVVDRNIILIRNEGRLLTMNDLWFSDLDSDYDILNIEYNCTNLTNIYFLEPTNHSNFLTRFTQRDIKNNDVYIKHHGTLMGQNHFTIHDGFFLVPAVVRVQANPKYLKVAETDVTLHILSGRSAILESSHFNLETNLFDEEAYERSIEMSSHKNISVGHEFSVQSAKNIKFFLLKPPLHGNLFCGDHETAWQFTMEDVYNKLIKYKHANLSNEDDSFQFLVKIGMFSGQGIVRISTRKNLKEVPRLLNNKVAIVDFLRGEEFKFSEKFLSVSHPVAKAEEIIFSVTSKPRFGHLVFEKSSKEITKFKQSDINEGKLHYKYKPHSRLKDILSRDNQGGFDQLPTGDSVTLSTSCCNGSALEEIVFVFEFVPEIIDISVDKITVDENGNYTFARSLFQGSKLFFPHVDIFIIEGPSHGYVASKSKLNYHNYSQRNNSLISRVTRFTSDQINEQRIFYFHDGSETREDFFVVVFLSDARKRMSEFLKVEIEIVPVNDQPPVLVNKENVMAEKGSWTVLTRGHLRATDEDTDESEIFFNIINLSSGEMYLNQYSMKRQRVSSGPMFTMCGYDETSNWIPIKSFSQADINKGAVVYSAEETGDHILLMELSDGRFKTMNISIEIKTIHANLSRFAIKKLFVFPGVPQELSLDDDSHNLNKIVTHDKHFTCSANFYFINYQILSLNGHIIIAKNRNKLLEKNVQMSVKSFSFDDILQKKIFYKSYLQPANSEDKLVIEMHIRPWDGLVLNEKVETSTDVDVSLCNINIKNVDFLLNIEKEMTVEEGRNKTVTLQNLNDLPLANLLSSHYNDLMFEFAYKISEAPKHGDIYLAEEKLERNQTFKQSDIESSRVYYIHDDSDSLDDQITLQVVCFKYKIESAHIVQEIAADGLNDNKFTLNLKITPRDDQPFELLSNNLDIKLVQGTYLRITKDILHTTDPDTSPNRIIYDTINYPTSCILILLDKSESFADLYETIKTWHKKFSNTADVTVGSIKFGVKTFTQEDIDSERLVIYHKSKDANDDAYYFNVSDQVYKPMSKILNIEVIPSKTQIKSNVSELRVKQASMRSIVTQEQLDVVTNKNRNQINYNITHGPYFGLIYRNAMPVDGFNQMDVDRGLVSYIQTDFSSSHDELELVTLNNIYIVVRITVVPDRNSSFTSPPLETARMFTITAEYLDASHLALQTDSDPLYEITSLPKKGKLMLQAVGHLKQRRDAKSRTIKQEKQKASKRYINNKYKNIANRIGHRHVANKTGNDNDTNTVHLTFHHSDVIKRRVVYAPDAVSTKKMTNSMPNHEIDDYFEFILSAPRAQPIIGRFQLQHHKKSTTETVSIFLNENTTLKAEIDENSEMKPMPSGSDESSTGKVKIVLSIVFVVISFAAAFVIYKCLKRRQKKKMQQISVPSMTNVKASESNNDALNSKHITESEHRNEFSAVKTQPASTDLYKSTSKTSLAKPPIGASSPKDTEKRYSAASSKVHTSGIQVDKSPLDGTKPVDNLQKNLNGISKNVFQGPSKPSAEKPQQNSPKSMKRLETSAEKSRSFEWENVDPELLQHCRRTTPVLHSNQYWV